MILQRTELVGCKAQVERDGRSRRESRVRLGGERRRGRDAANERSEATKERRA